MDGPRHVLLAASWFAPNERRRLGRSSDRNLLGDAKHSLAATNERLRAVAARECHSQRRELGVQISRRAGPRQARFGLRNDSQNHRHFAAVASQRQKTECPRLRIAILARNLSRSPDHLPRKGLRRRAKTLRQRFDAPTIGRSHVLAQLTDDFFGRPTRELFAAGIEEGNPPVARNQEDRRRCPPKDLLRASQPARAAFHPCIIRT